MAGAVLSSEKNIMLGQDIVIPKSVLADPRFDYVAMGHIHKYQVLTHQRPAIVYPGSLERIDFGEGERQEGLCGRRNRRFGERKCARSTPHLPPREARRFLTIEVNADMDFPTEEVLRRIEERAEESATR